MTTPTAIIVHGRRWFDTRAGNTYHDAQAFVIYDNDPEIHQYAVGFSYGYDDQYQESAYAKLIELGVLPDKESYPSGATSTLRSYCRDNSIKLIARASDVTRKRDLLTKAEADTINERNEQ